MLRVTKIVVLPTIAFALAIAPVSANPSNSTTHSSSLGVGKEHWGQMVIRNSSYREMLRGSASQGCVAKRPPEAIATPNPLLDADEDLRLTVSFVVGTDGRVSNPLVLEGASADQARPVLDALSPWRYRPAVCNGAPAEFEAKVEFSSAPNRF